MLNNAARPPYTEYWSATTLKTLSGVTKTKGAHLLLKHSLMAQHSSWHNHTTKTAQALLKELCKREEEVVWVTGVYLLLRQPVLSKWACTCSATTSLSHRRATSLLLFWVHLLYKSALWNPHGSQTEALLKLKLGALPSTISSKPRA